MKIMAKENNWTVNRVKAVVMKAIGVRSDVVSISDVSVSSGGYYSVDIEGDIFSDELNKIACGVRDKFINVSANCEGELNLFFKPDNRDPKEFGYTDDDKDDEPEPEEEDRPLTAIPDDMRHTARFPDSEDVIIPGTEQRVSNTEQCQQIMKWMQETGHMPIVYVRLDDGVHVEVSEVYDRRIKAVIKEGKAIGADARRYTFDEGGDLWPIGSDICIRATCDETGRSDMYGLSFFV